MDSYQVAAAVDSILPWTYRGEVVALATDAHRPRAAGVAANLSTGRLRR